jgi:hypothetical protein
MENLEKSNPTVENTAEKIVQGASGEEVKVNGEKVKLNISKI